MEYEPDADMIFNYLMVSALAAATDLVEREGLKPRGGNSSFPDKMITEATQLIGRQDKKLDFQRRHHNIKV